ncbi:Ig-like domain repeat protein, partial [Methanobrevibacter smithii]|uniref:Ig-like domain repeat protein n=1 Tax=Methanobrevibacter smithii TaxID=2173 RepID=UPI0037DD6495
MDKKILLICLIAIVAFSISCVSAADSNEIAMNSSDAVGISEDVSVDDVVFANQISSEDSQVVGDSPSGEVWVATTGSDDNDGSQANPVASVSKAVDLAQSGSTIHIKEGTYNHGKISLNKTLSFVGEGKVILNSNGANVFACEKDGYNLEFTNLVFTGVSSTAGTSCGLKVGGNGNLKVINCTFTDISAKYGAMQLYTTGVADIINSTIKDVVSGTSNGCIVYISGSGTYNFNNLSIINPKLADSVVAGSPYAFLRNVFYSYGKEATVTLTNSIITGASGPIQAVVESRGKLTIYNTVISNNVVGKTTTSYGKYLLYVGEVTALNMTNCIIENNTFADSSSALIYFNSACKANITYSSIVDNGFSKNVDVKSGITPTVNLDYNWWGTNTYTGDNVNKWVVMSTPETTINAESGKAIDVSVNFNHYTDASGSIQDLAQSISGINVDFSAVSGTLSKNNVASVDGIATVTYTTTTNDKITAKSGSQSLTIDVTVSSGDDNVVTKETFFNFFDSEGNLLDSITYDTLIFKGEFSNLGINVITISKPLTINGNNAVLKNIGFAIVSGDVTLNGLTLAGNTLSEEIEGSVININDVENVMLSNLNIDYSSVSNDLDIALIKCVQSANVELVDSNIKYVGNKIEEGLTNYVIYVDTCPNMVIKGNTITASLYPHNINFGDIIDSAAIYVEAGVIGDSINLTNNTISIDVLASDIKKGAVYGLYSAYSESYLNDNTIVLTNKNEGYCKVYAVYSQPGVVSEFNNILINASSNGIADGIYGLRVTVENTNVTIVSNGPAVGINSISGKNVIKNSKINVTGLATNTDSVLGITFEKMGDLIGNSIYVHNMGKYSDDNLIYGIFSTKDTKSNIKNNEITSEGNYAIYLSRASDSNITDNILYAHELKGNDAVNVIGTNNIIKDNKPITVTDVWVSASGSDANDGSQDSPVATIAKAIELVAEGYTIHVGEGTYIANSLTIAKSFAMIGSGKVIIDGNASKIMNINENTIVNFTNVAFTNALNNYGGVMQSKGTVNLNNVSIYKNTQKSGSTPTVSSIYNTGVMTIVNSNIYENDGYGLIFNSGNLDIINTSISSNNVAKGTTYAFLYIDGGAVNVINSTLSDNTARLGGIWLNKGTLNVNNATFENNVVTVGNGGAIHIESDSSTATIKDSKFIGNKANKDGGAIYNKGTLNIETSIFDANAASNGNTGYYGDDIYNSGILTLHYSALLGKGTNKLIYNEGREPSANAQYNWWGTNSNPSTLVGAGLDYDDEPCDDVDVSNWVVMSVDPTSIEKVIVGNEKTLTVNFNHYNANGVIKELAKSIPSINVNFEAVNGTLSSDVAATDNGVASVTYTVKGNDQITVKSGSQTLTVPVTTKELTNIVTNETFFDYFGDDGMLLGDITFDTLIFKGEFSNLGVNVVYVPRAIVINGDNAVLRNIAIMCEQGTTLNNLTLNATNYVADTDGALIYAIGSDVTVNNITIDYNATDGSNNAIAVYASGADNFKLVNSTITFTGNNVDGKVFAQGIKIAKSNNAVVDSNIITTSCPLVDVEYSHWGSIDTDLVFAIGVEKSENVKIINNIVDNSAWTKGNNANFPTFDAFIAHTANNLLIKNNTISHTDLITLKGNSSYIYALDFYESNSVIVEDNRVLLNTTGGKEGAGAAYAVQVTGPYNNFVVKGNNLTTVSNGPNLGVYSQNYYGATEITAENNWINVTGFAGPAEFALVSGMEFQDTVAKAYNNTIYVQNVNEYNDDNNIAGITYVQSTSGSHQFDIQNNTIYSEGKYAVLIKSAKDSQIIGNTLYAHELNGDDAAIFKSGTNNVVKNNYPMSTDIIIDVNNAWIGKEAVIGITLNSAATGTANIMVGGKTYTVNLTDGKATLKVSDLPAGENTVKVDYDGDGKFKSSTNSTTFKVFDGIVTNETFFDYFINGTLADYVPEGATLDFRGKFYSHDDVKFDLVINKPINMISTTGDAFIDLNTTAGSLLGENPGSCFTINNGGSGSNVSGIIFHNTQVWIYDAHNVVLNNISVIVENKRVGSGVGTTAIRHGSTNVTLKNSYIYTSNNGGSSSIVLTHVQNCTVENNTIVGEGNVGNLLYLNTFNDAGCDLS